MEISRQGTTSVVRLEDVETFLRRVDPGSFFSAGVGNDGRFECLVRQFLASSTRLHHPGYMAHQVALPNYGSALADLISGVLNNGMSVYEMGPAAGAIEVAVIDWMLDKIGWPPTGRNRDQEPAAGRTPGGGVLTHGGTLANLTALLAARAASAPEAWAGGTPRDLVLLASPVAHYSIFRAAAILGLGTGAILPIPSDRFGRILPAGLAALVQRARSEGCRVMAVCVNACATATGLFDPLQAAGEFCRESGIWLHVDGAHGASALLHPALRQRLSGIELADSVVWDTHKLLGTSALATGVLVRDGSTLGRTFQQEAAYVTEGQRETGVDFIESQFECTKAPLGLKLFLTLAVTGETGLAANIETLFSLTRRVHGQIASRNGFEVLCEPESNILCFRLRSGDDALQTRIRKDLMRRGEFLLSQADVDGQRWLRLTLMNPLTDETTIERLLDAIEVLASGSQG
ncbi:MAG: aminotransferase class V-fold PLP-dependent enzyme [Acidobacteria bacterium]|nr:aminotransferase class V-fold PLP-dependent enzyme [Acidobacteriota bacterium]